MLIAEFDKQSSAADFDETIQLFSEQNGDPMWTSVPVDLILTMIVIPETETSQTDYGEISISTPKAVITASSTDATGRVTPYANGIITIHLDDTDMYPLAPENYSIDKRYRVFLKYQLGTVTKQLLIAALPVFRGA